MVHQMSKSCPSYPLPATSSPCPFPYSLTRSNSISIRAPLNHAWGIESEWVSEWQAGKQAGRQAEIGVKGMRERIVSGWTLTSKSPRLSLGVQDVRRRPRHALLTRKLSVSHRRRRFASLRFQPPFLLLNYPHRSDWRGRNAYTQPHA